LKSLHDALVAKFEPPRKLNTDLESQLKTINEYFTTIDRNSTVWRINKKSLESIIAEIKKVFLLIDGTSKLVSSLETLLEAFTETANTEGLKDQYSHFNSDLEMVIKTNERVQKFVDNKQD